MKINIFTTVCLIGLSAFSFSQNGKDASYWEITRAINVKANPLEAKMSKEIGEQKFDEALQTLNTINKTYSEFNRNYLSYGNIRVECLYGLGRFKEVVEEGGRSRGLLGTNMARLAEAKVALKYPLDKISFDAKLVMERDSHLTTDDVPASDTAKNLSFNLESFWGLYLESSLGQSSQKALAHMLKAHKLNPKSSFVNYHLGLLYTGQKQKEIAKSYHTMNSQSRGYFGEASRVELEKLKATSK